MVSEPVTEPPGLSTRSTIAGHRHRRPPPAARRRWCRRPRSTLPNGEHLTAAAAADDRAVQCHDGDRRLTLAAGHRRHRQRGRALRPRVARQVQPRRGVLVLVGVPARCPARRPFRRSARRPRHGTRCGRPDRRPPRRRATAAPGRRARRRPPTLDPARLGDRLPHLGVQALDQPAVGLPVGVGVAVLGEKVCRRLVFAARDELRLEPALSSASRRNSALVAKPTSPTVPDGCIHTSPNADAR